MKKIVFLILMFILNISIVRGEVFYGEYKEIDTPLPISDLVKVNSYKVYNTFNYELIDKGYLSDNDLYIKDENDYKYEFVENINNPDNEMISLNINNLLVDNINILNINNKSKIYEIEVYNKGVKIDYNYNTLHINNKVFINNNDFRSFSESLFYQAKINLLFTEQYNLNDLTLVIYSINEDLDNKMTISVGDNNYPLILNKYVTYIKFSNESSEKYGTYKKYYKYYENKYNVLNEYKTIGDNLILDDYKIINDYFIRDKLELVDDIIIKRRDYNIKDYILYESGNTNILCNIDINNNGIYSCRFKLNDIDVNKDIIVDINKDDNESNYLNNNEVKKEDIKLENVNNKVSNKEIKKNYKSDNNLTIKSVDKEDEVKTSIIKENIMKDDEVSPYKTTTKLKEKKEIKYNKKKLIKIVILFIYIIIVVLSVIKKKKKFCRKGIKK